ncbi:MAG: hypothetical protein EOP84_01820, partial [Verrucomicrobiaceae bacterium]
MRHIFFATLLSVSLSLEIAAEEPADTWNFKVGMMADSSGEGPERDRPYIMMGKQRIAFAQPFKSRMTSDAQKLSIHFPDRGLSSQIIVEESPFKPDALFATMTEDYYQAAEVLLPKEAQEIEFKGANTSAYAVNEWKCQVFEWSYLLGGRRFYCQIGYINIDAQHQI